MNRTFAALAAAALIGAGAAQAQDTIKIGIINAYSGQFADPGNQLDAGIELYIAQHGDMVAGKKIELIRKDVGGIAPDVAKRLAEELVVRDQVDILVGGLLTPNTMAVGDVSAEAEKFQVVMNATTPVIITKSPYMIRTSVTASQLNYNFGLWVYDQGVREAYTMVSDYGPGIGAGAAYEKAFLERGGTIVGSDKTPVANPDFAPFAQRIADADPESLYIFVPGGAQPPALVKALSERGVVPGVKVYAQGELTSDAALEAVGEGALGIVTATHYESQREDPINAEFIAAYHAANDGRNPDLYSVGGYDGMHVVYEALKATGGNTDAAALTEAAIGLEWVSPRGPIRIDESRESIQSIWLTDVRMVDGEPKRVVFDEIKEARPPAD